MRASHEPNTHFHIFAIASACLELAGRSEDTRKNARWVPNLHPAYSLSVFQRNFPYKLEEQHQLMVGAIARAGIPP